MKFSPSQKNQRFCRKIGDLKKNTVVFYPIKKEIDTIDGMWISGLPNEVKIIITGQEYVTVGQVIQSE